MPAFTHTAASHRVLLPRVITNPRVLSASFFAPLQYHSTVSHRFQAVLDETKASWPINLLDTTFLNELGKYLVLLCYTFLLIGILESCDGKHIEGIQVLFLKIYTSYKEGHDFMVGHLGVVCNC